MKKWLFMASLIVFAAFCLYIVLINTIVDVKIYQGRRGGALEVEIVGDVLIRE